MLLNFDVSLIQICLVRLNSLCFLSVRFVRVLWWRGEVCLFVRVIAVCLFVCLSVWLTHSVLDWIDVT
jgi:hypothetical protein